MTILKLTGASLVAVLGTECAFSRSSNNRGPISTFAVMPSYIAPAAMTRAIVECLGDDFETLRHVTVIQGDIESRQAALFVQCCKLALVAICGATGASLHEVPGFDIDDPAAIAVEIETERRKRAAVGQSLGKRLFDVDHAIQINSEAEALREHVNA